MNEVSIISLDLVKTYFKRMALGPMPRLRSERKLLRAQLPRMVATEACGSAHHWGRTIGDLDHEAMLMPPAYVKLFVKRKRITWPMSAGKRTGPDLHISIQARSA